MQKKLQFLIIILIGVAIISCKEKNAASHVTRSFYYWKSYLNPSAFEKRKLDSLRIENLYVKFFDVVWDELTRKPTPSAKISIKDTAWLHSKNIIPVVFITNETIFKLDSLGIETLAIKISWLIHDFANLYGVIGFKELQIDCDWTAGTKDSYFQLLRIIKKQYPQKKLSATIRLHQVKFKSSGIPPVDKGLLMCYNMGNLQRVDVKNSIIDVNEFEKYVDNVRSYSLPLDVGLPLFEWGVLFTNNKFAGLIQNLPDEFYKNPVFKKQGTGYIIQRDTLVNGRLLKEGDFLRYETSDYKTVMQVAQSIAEKLHGKAVNVSFYHVDSLILKKYSCYELENIYNCFRYP